MSIKRDLFQFIRERDGNVEYNEATDFVLGRYSTSKWDIKHWRYYVSNIIRPNGRYYSEFSETVRQNLRLSNQRNNNTLHQRSVSNIRPLNTNSMHTRYPDKTKEVEHELADILARVSHHVHPEIVKRIVEANKGYKEEFGSFCPADLQFEDYFYEGSDCVFPGVRRCINGEKVGRWKNAVNRTDCTILNDNTFPRHLWVFLCTNRAFAGGEGGVYASSGLNAFELAHIFSHKKGERTLEPKVFLKFDKDISPYALFSGASNTVLIPKGIPKPTDKLDNIKIVFYKRHLDLYGDISALPGLSDFDEKQVPEWYGSLKWLDPILPDNWQEKVDNLLKYRNKYLREKYGNWNRDGDGIAHVA